jgi:hypothetical protein
MYALLFKILIIKIKIIFNFNEFNRKVIFYTKIKIVKIKF